MTTNNKLELMSVTGADGGCTPVDGVSLHVEPGETLAILGPERAGKSSLIRLIAGFGEVVGGHISFNGHNLAKVAPRRRPFALLGERDALFPHLTVRKNIAYGLKAHRLDPRDIEERIHENLAYFEITALLNDYPDGLSRSDRHKVALARALATRPLVVLMDQPFDALDPMLAGQLMFTLRDLQRHAGFSVVMATRDSEAALAVSDRIAVMSEGRLLQVGTPDALFDRPEHALVATLTGPVNLIYGTAHGNAIEVSGLGALPANASALPAGTPAVLCLRPDLLELSLYPPESAEIAVQFEVRDVTYAGGGLRVRLENGSHRLAARLDGRRLTSGDLPAGRQIWCTWDRDAAHVLGA